MTTFPDTWGRSMELALAFALEIEGTAGISLHSAGTDGPTGAAGAVVDGTTTATARGMKVDPVEILCRNDSNNFFRKVDGLLVTGPTGTSVMDLQVVLID